ncbi:MAG: chemotaxis protein CheA [Cypionkella sp.]
MAEQNSIRDMFFEESEELLEALSEGLGLMEAGQQDDETVNAVFRAVHSIKGGAGAFKLDKLVAFAHRFETVLDEVRAHRMALDPEVMRTLQRSADHLVDLVEDARTGNESVSPQTPEFLEALDACLANAGTEVAEEVDLAVAYAPMTIDLGDFSLSEEPETQNFQIRFRPHGTLYANGHDPALFIEALGEIGKAEVTIDLTGLPELEAYDPGHPCLIWDIRLETAMPQDIVVDVFEFVEGLCDLEVMALEAGLASTPPVEAMAPDIGVDPLEASPPTAKPVLPVPSEAQPSLKAPVAESQAETAAQGDKSGPKPTLRVELDRVDRLINAVGELIINQSMIAQRLDDLRLATDADVVTHVEDYRLLARDLQEAVMAIRAQPVKPLFQRLSRIVRDAADATGKTVRLVTVGESVEVDKTVVERLTDPLTHMIRNAVDHGLERPDARVEAGKDPCGTIRLSAAHRSGSVIITIRDDGAGLNRPRILEIARSKGLVSEQAELSEAEIDALLFLPGFSTASTISNLSGRGVGLDVVRNSVMALGGRVSISSIPGQGTEFTISLPLTLAVLDGMVVSVAGQVMVIPITTILETIRPNPGDLHPMANGDRLFAIRGKFIPIVDIAEGLGFVAPPGHPEAATLLLVETENQGECALIVDRVFDQRQVVIKGLDTNYGAVPGVSAATVLGDGQIALILDPEAIASKKLPRARDLQFSPRMNEGKSLANA